jgi:RNA polymerase sigma-70 factor (ECF subfamily)
VAEVVAFPAVVAVVEAEAGAERIGRASAFFRDSGLPNVPEQCPQKKVCAAAPSRRGHAYRGAVDTQSVHSLRETPVADDRVLQRAKNGDFAAFRELLRTHKSRVFSMALRLLGNNADAEEVAQDVFLQLHGALAQLSTPEHLKHWLLRAISHRCIDQLRRQGSRPRLVSIEALPEAARGSVADEGGDLLAAAQVRRLVLELSPDAQAVLLLRFQEELVPTEIATVLVMPLNTVKSHLRRSLEWLRAQLEGDSHGS